MVIAARIPAAASSPEVAGVLAWWSIILAVPFVLLDFLIPGIIVQNIAFGGFVTASLDDLLCGLSPCRHPAPVGGGHDAGGRPVAGVESLERLAATATRVRARPVIGRGQPPVAILPVTHRAQHPITGPPALDRAGTARLAVRVSVALAIARLGVRRSHGTRPRSAP